MGRYSNGENGSPADEYFPRIIPDDDGIQDETDLEEPINPEWLDRIFRVTGQIAAASIVVGLTLGVIIICVGGVWCLLKLMF